MKVYHSYIYYCDDVAVQAPGVSEELVGEYTSQIERLREEKEALEKKNLEVKWVSRVHILWNILAEW